MLWLLLDLLLVLAAFVGLGVAGLTLWRRIKELSRQVAKAGETVGAASETLAAAQSPTSHRG